jgi:predicted site-specific integrase-resolvase
MNGSDTNDQYVTSSSIRKTFGVSNTTLRNWAESGRVRVVRVGGDTGKRLYLKSDIQREFTGFKPRTTEGKATAIAGQKRVCYARVSSAKQKDDLARQVEALKAQFPEHEIITDIASGLNWKRPGFLRILDQASEGTLSEIVVATRDRLCRFAFELVQHIVKKNGCKLVVLAQGDGSSTSTDTGVEEAQASELKDDLLAIVTCFVASNNGKRAAAHRRAKREREAREKEQTTQTSDDEDSTSEESEDGGRKPAHKRAKRKQVPQEVDLPDSESEEDN